jgi:hypothetical protein
MAASGAGSTRKHVRKTPWTRMWTALCPRTHQPRALAGSCNAGRPLQDHYADLGEGAYPFALDLDDQIAAMQGWHDAVRWPR